MGYLALAKQMAVLRDSTPPGTGEPRPAVTAPAHLAKPSLAEYAADHYGLTVRCTIHETEDVSRDIALLHQVRQAIEEFQPGSNRVLLRIVTLDGRRPVVLWRAYADPALRRRLARLLAEHALEQVQ